jgi:hypothetical protein
MFNRRRAPKAENPNSRLQTPSNFQFPRPKRRADFNKSGLELIWCLVIGIWYFPTKSRSSQNTRIFAEGCGGAPLPLKCGSSSGALAQLVRAPPCHGGGCGFEPRRLRKIFLFLSIFCKRLRGFLYYAKSRQFVRRILRAWLLIVIKSGRHRLRPWQRLAALPEGDCVQCRR